MAKRTQMPKGTGSGQAKARPGARKQTGSPLLLWIVIGAVAVVVIGVILIQMQSLNKPVVATGQITEGTTWGPANAPVTVTEYADFGCTYCRQFAVTESKQLRQEYEPTGKVRFVFKSFIIEGPSTRDAANAAYCAADQGRFWDYYDVLFSKSGTAAPDVVFSKTALKQYGAQLGLDTTTFNACVDSGKHIQEIQNQQSEGSRLGVQATPTFFVNNQKLEGAVPYADMKSVIDRAIASAGS